MLQGVRMVFSGVIPVSGGPADSRTHRLWKMAESHGAIVESSIGPHTTHVVAVRLGTAKVRCVALRCYSATGRLFRRVKVL